MALEPSRIEAFACPCPERGSLELVQYTSRAYALEALFGGDCIPMEKSMWVYKPYGYDLQKQYNVLFLMHGGTENEGYWFGTGRYYPEDRKTYTDFGNVTAGMLDRLIYEKEIDPLLVVAPSFEEEVQPYASQGNRMETYFAPTRYFWQELRNEIMPLVQARYATYAAANTDSAFQAAREHFAYAGASQGSITGLYSVMVHCLDRFAWIGSYSAGAICYNFADGKLTVKLDEERLEEVSNAIQQGPQFTWYCGCGTDDMMYATHKQTYDRLTAALPEKLRAGENCRFVSHEGGIHHYRTWCEDLDNTLRLFSAKRGAAQ